MAELAAPYFSANDLNAQAGNAALGGGMQQNPNILPNSGLGNTIDQLIAEKASATEAKKQRIFQQQQAEERYRQDALTRVQDYAHSDAVMKYKQGQEDIRNIYQQLANGQQSAFNAKDAQGNDQSFQPAPGDQDVMNKSADDLRKRIHADPSLATDPAFNQDFLNHQKMVATAGTRAVTLTKLKQQLAQTTDPAERKNIQDSMDEIVNTPTNQLPDSHLPTPLDVNLIPTDEELAKMYPQGKGYQSYTDESGNEKVGLPEHHIDEIIYAPAGSAKARQISNAVSLFQKDPIANDPTAFTQWSAQVNQRRRDMGQPELNLGQVTKDGQVILNPDKRLVAAGLALMHAPWQDDPDADSDEDKALKSANIAHVRAETQALTTGKPKATTPQEAADQHDAELTVKRVKEIYNPSHYPGKGTSLVATVKKGKDGNDKTTYNTVDGVDLAPILKDKGLNPGDWGVYNTQGLPDVSDMIGVEKTNQEKSASGDEKGVEQRTGQNMQADKTFAIKNKKTGDVRLVYVGKEEKDKKEDPDTYKAIAIVEGRDAAANTAKTKHQYKTESGKLPDEISRLNNTWDEQGGKTQAIPKPAAPSFTPKVAGKKATTRNNNGVPEVNVGGVWKKIKGRKPDGELITE